MVWEIVGGYGYGVWGMGFGVRGHMNVEERPCVAPGTAGWCCSRDFISHKVLLKSFCKSQFPHNSVSISFILAIEKIKLTDLWGS